MHWPSGSRIDLLSLVIYDARSFGDKEPCPAVLAPHRLTPLGISLLVVQALWWFLESWEGKGLVLPVANNSVETSGWSGNGPLFGLT